MLGLESGDGPAPGAPVLALCRTATAKMSWPSNPHRNDVASERVGQASLPRGGSSLPSGSKHGGLRPISWYLASDLRRSRTAE